MRHLSDSAIETSDPETRPLVILSRARIALAEATSLNEIKDVRDKAEAVRHYARSIAIGLELHNHAAEIKLRAERKAGDLLKSLSLRGGDRKSKHHDDALKLADLGIDANQSARWQREAAVPDDVFQLYIDDTNAAKREISAAGLLAIAKKRKTHTPASISTTSDAYGLPIDAFLTGVNTAPSVNESEDGDTESECVASDESRLSIIQEAKNHVNAMTQILARARTDDRVELPLTEFRYIQRLLLDVDKLLDQL